jgi:hypothetical protein
MRIPLRASWLRSCRPARRAVELLRRNYPVVVGLALSLGLAIPFAIRQNAWFEWANPYWLLLQQREHILAAGRPTYFIHTTATGLYYPVNLFYGGFTITVLAYLAAVIPPSLVFSATIVASFFAAFVGILWAARALGVGTPMATVAAALYVANPQYVAKLYTRGAWAELVAVSMLTLVLGSAVRAMTDHDTGRSTTLPIAFVAIGTLMLAGTHNLTLAVGLPFVAALVVAHAASLHHDIRSIGRTLVPPALAGLVGLAVSAAFTIPNLWLSGSTAITAENYLDLLPELNTPSAVFRPHPTGLHARMNEVPSLLVVPIVLLAIATLKRGRAHEPARHGGHLAVVAAALALLLTVLTTQGSLWSDPNSILHRLAPEKALITLQFPLRLTAFLALALLVVVISLEGRAANTRLARAARATIVVAATWYVSFGLVFGLAADRTPPETTHEMSFGLLEAQSIPSSFAPAQQTQFLLTERGVALERPSHTATFNRDGRVESTTPIEPGTVVATNVVWSPLVRFTGADLLGRDDLGRAVIAVRSPTSEAIAVTTRRPPAVLAGIVVSLLGVGAAVRWLFAVWTKRRTAAFANYYCPSDRRPKSSS